MEIIRSFRWRRRLNHAVVISCHENHMQEKVSKYHLPSGIDRAGKKDFENEEKKGTFVFLVTVR
jgi:hypothetical protein